MGKLIINNTVVSKLFLGSTEINKAYIGNTLIYQKGIPNGVYILRTDNLLYTSDNWNTSWNDEAVGVAVISDLHPAGGFLIAKNALNAAAWGTNGKTINNIMTTTSIKTAKTDYQGLHNTDQVITQDGSAAVAFNECRGFTFPNGKKGYMGALGEWSIAHQNKAEVDGCLSKIGGDIIKIGYYWASTQESSSHAFTLGWNAGDGGKTSKDSDDLYVRAFGSLN